MSVTPTHDGALKITCDECGAEARIEIATCTAEDIEEWLKKHGWRSVFQAFGAFSHIDDLCPKCVEEEAVQAKERQTMEQGDERDGYATGDS